ncbi:MAG: type II secretion system minor pseudopilin GspK [Pseudomonadales bacterium]
MARPRRLNRGVVLLTTLLLMAILAGVGWNLSGRQTLLVTEHRMAFANDQAFQYALGAETFARQILRQDWAQEGDRRDTLLEPWAQSPPPFAIDNGSIELRARDLNGCFNLNALAVSAPDGTPEEPGDAIGGVQIEPVNALIGTPREPGNTLIGTPREPGTPGNRERFQRLLAQVGLTPDLADSWRDWLDPDDTPAGAGAEDGDYLLESPAYRTANQPAAHVSEFDLLRGNESDARALLSELVCVLPDTGLKVNVNTAVSGVLAALIPEPNLEALAEFAAAPRDLSDVGQFTAQFPEFSVAVDALTVSSEYFEISVRVRVDDSTVEMVSVIHRDPASGRLSVISRDLSRYFLSRAPAAAEANQSIEPAR